MAKFEWQKTCHKEGNACGTSNDIIAEDGR